MYLDLGNHPGKDRLPREAALHGCVVVVARRGSAAFPEDVPLDPQFRIPDGRGLIDRAEVVVRSVLANPEPSLKAQEQYALWVRGERPRFAAEVQAAVDDVLD